MTGVRRPSNSRTRSARRSANGLADPVTVACSGSCSGADVIPSWRALACAVGLGVTLATGTHTASGQPHRPYRPAFDVLDYAITLDLPDSGATIHAEALLSVARTGSRDTLTLDLLDLTVDRVTVDGRAV